MAMESSEILDLRDELLEKVSGRVRCRPCNKQRYCMTSEEHWSTGGVGHVLWLYELRTMQDNIS